ncbi:ahpC/TSA family protein [Orientia chuto str. Dubai]|uniref:AhpC/TSA family protein n=1 Tax=Orientia chuto str. Dubai TaxID=1359168 RepID=A0A0F3MLM8_9RICK|nr:SCO family protein [Candidatus Orientia mediorientalis]KJV56630.1 ahpC/TSA family protein [Orientia chuto str. Dubai]
MDTKNNKRFFNLLAVISIVIGVLSLYFILVLWPQSKKVASTTSHSAVASSEIGGNFTLIDVNDQEFNSESLKGKPYLIYFGFTFCPDVCPATLDKLSKVIKILDMYHIDMSTIFVTVDPKRDNASTLKNYMTNFHSKIIALTGTEFQIKDITKKFGVYYTIAALSDSNSKDYLIDHSTFIYLMDKNGKYISHFTLEDSPEKIIEYIRVHLK